jgi:hypothetical protein
MTTAATSLLGLALPVTGELSGTWGDTVNNSITSLVDSAIAGTTTLSTDADVTLTTTTLSANQAREAILLWTASGTVTRNITAPAQSKAYIVINATGSTQSIVLRGAGPTTGVTIVAAEKALCAWNGSDFVKIATTASVSSFSAGTTGLTPSTSSTGAVTLAGTLGTANGGTGLTAFTSGGVPYATSTSALATGTSLQFDGTNFSVGAAPVASKGTLQVGTIGYTDTGVVAAFASSVAGYNQIVLQNTNAGSTASTNFNVSNNNGTTTTNYGEFGINSSAFTGTGSFSQGGYTYLASASTDLAIGTYGSNAIHFVVNSGATDAMSVSSTGLINVNSSSAGTALLTVTSSTTTEALKVPNIAEPANVVGSAPSATTNFYVASGAVQYYTTNSANNWTLNIAFSSGTSLNTAMATNDSISITMLATQGSTAYYNSAVTIDGTSVTPKWQGGSAPTSGNASGIDSYTYVVLKTASATYTVLASQTKFA